MIAVEPTQQNWDIYDRLCELDAEYRVSDEQGRRDIISLAQRLCDELEV